jgi:hypothetical protein
VRHKHALLQLAIYCLTVFIAELRALAAPNWGLFFSRRRQTSETKEPSSAVPPPTKLFSGPSLKAAGPQATFGTAQPLWPT